jgi:ERF superfamily
MTDTDKQPRRPIVPGPTSASGGGSISARAIATREAQREAAIGGLPAARELHNEMDRQARGIAGLGRAPEVFTRNFGPVGNIAGAIANVMANIGTIEKGGFNAFHRYHYARMEDLLVALTPLMGQNGLAVFQNEIKIEMVEGNRVAVSYEFSVIHKSGEIWPERPRFTGMSTARDSKGNWDDKALAKCHTQARKYFLLALFQVPAGDFDDNDAGDANRRQEQQPVPGPKSAPAQAEPAPAKKSDTPKKSVDEIVLPDKPQKLGLGAGAGADQWANLYLRVIAKCASQDEVKAWDAANDQALQHLSDNYGELYDMVSDQVEKRLKELAPEPAKAEPVSTIPNPKSDPVVAMNAIAEQLQQFRVYEDAEKFWNENVAPLEDQFELDDWNMLIREWNRTEGRLAPEPPEAA